MLSLVTAWIDLDRPRSWIEGVMLSEISQQRKANTISFTFMWMLKNNINE